MEPLYTWHVFPGVEQIFYPNKCNDGRSGHFLHLTQLPKGTITDKFGFEWNLCQITLWNESSFNLTRGYVENQIVERVNTMDMQLGESVTPNMVVFAPDDKWLVFVKLSLQNPKDCLDLINRRRPFVISINLDSLVILKVERILLPTKSARIAVHVDDSGVIEKLTSKQVTSNAVYGSYCLQLKYKIIWTSKSSLSSFA